MSIPVAIADLEKALTGFGDGYLLTTTDGRVKVISVDATCTDSVVTVANSSPGTRTNLAGNDTVTLVFPPLEPRGYTLLVDGTAAVHEHAIRIEPRSAILHRPAEHATTAVPVDGCGADCHHV